MIDSLICVKTRGSRKRSRQGQQTHTSPAGFCPARHSPQGPSTTTKIASSLPPTTPQRERLSSCAMSSPGGPRVGGSSGSMQGFFSACSGNYCHHRNEVRTTIFLFLVSTDDPRLQTYMPPRALRPGEMWVMHTAVVCASCPRCSGARRIITVGSGCGIAAAAAAAVARPNERHKPTRLFGYLQ